MWWREPPRSGFRPLLPANLLDVVVHAFAVAQCGGLTGTGAARGRNFEQLFYGLCDARGVDLCERAGGRTVAGGKSASGFAHEVDGATKALSCITHWELKHLSIPVPKNELLIFNGKGLDFLQGCSRLVARTPMHRFLLSGGNVRDECRRYAVLWGIVTIEPDLLPLPLLWEAVARGLAIQLTEAERDVVIERVPWGCRPLQRVLRELHDWSSPSVSARVRCGPSATYVAKEILDVQEQLGPDVMDCLDEVFPDWLDDAAEHVWQEVGGW